MTEMNENLLYNYLNFIMDGMSLKTKEERLFEYLVNDYKDLSDEQLTTEIRENCGNEWFEEWK